MKTLDKYGPVFVISETLEPVWEKYKLRVAPEKLHHLLYYASLYLGEGGTTAAEAAVLGTYAIHVSTTAKHCGIFTELHRYGLLDIFDGEEEALPKAIAILSSKNMKMKCRQKRMKLLKDKLDMTSFMVWLVDSFPESIQKSPQTRTIWRYLKGGRLEMRTLILSPHTDDAELGCGGLITRIIEKQSPLLWVVFQLQRNPFPRVYPKIL